MNRLFALFGTTVVAGLAAWVPPAVAQSVSSPSHEGSVGQMARAASGLIEGVVLDDGGSPLPGVTVSALGITSSLAVTDRQGAFRLKELRAGAYLVRAHLSGFAPSRREFVEVRPGRSARFSTTLRRIAAADDPPAVLAAGLGPVGDGPTMVEEAEAADTSEKAWRLRHLKRSVLKDTTERLALAEEEEPLSDSGGFAIVAKSDDPAGFLRDLPFTGQVNFLTSSTIGGGQSEVRSVTPLRGAAYVSVGGTAFGRGDWAARVMAQGEVGSWFVGGSYQSKAPSDHVFDLGVSYSNLRPNGGSPWSFSESTEGTRTAGAVYGVDRWAISRAVKLIYGGRYASYDYLPEVLFSPHVSLVLAPADGLRLTGSASRRMLAPGAEDFLEPFAAGFWIPPERTFVAASPLDPESTSHYELALERDVWRDLVVAVRAFLQETRSQQSALFGDEVLQPAAHYAVASTGDLDARGWSVGLSASPLSGTRGSVVYQMTDARWLVTDDPHGDVLLVGFGPRPARERLHDLTTSVETEISPTATTVFLACKLNSGFARREGDGVNPGVAARFDFQVVQKLPFLDFTSAQWQALVAVRSLFRDAVADASVYDELLVVQPPKRVVGGLLVRF